MFNKFKKGDKVIVKGVGENNGKIYTFKIGIVKQCDPYFKDYLVQFPDKTEDWFLPEYLTKKIKEEIK